MKKQNYIMPAAGMLISAALLFVTGCGDSGHDDGDMYHHDGDMYHHQEDMHMDMDHFEHSEAGHSHVGGGHMQHMGEVREWLKSELKDEYDEPVPLADEVTLDQGREVYLEVCSMCHGLTGKGDGPSAAGLMQKPSDFTDPAHATYYSDQGRLYIIRHGVAGTPMSGWEGILSEEEIQAVYAYVRSFGSS